MTLRVVHVVRQYHPSRGGMEDVVRNIARLQRDLYAHRPEIVTLNRIFRQDLTLAAREYLDDIPVTRLGYIGSERYPLCPAVLGHLRQADVVHVHGVDFFYDYLAAMHWWHGKPMVASTHGGFFHTDFARGFKEFFFRTVTRTTSRAYRRVLATSSSDGKIFSRILDPGRMRIIENGVDVEKYANAASAVRRPVLLYFGRWSVNKGLDSTLQLLQVLRALDADWRLIIAGREYDFDAAALRAMANAQGLADAVTLIPNPDDAALRALMAQATYFICQSRHEGFGLAAVEAMSAGLIPLLSGIGPFIRLAQDTAVPLLLPDASEEAAQALLALHARPLQDHARLRSLACQQAQRFSWRAIVGEYADEYARAVAHNATTPT